MKVLLHYTADYSKKSAAGLPYGMPSITRSSYESYRAQTHNLS